MRMSSRDNDSGAAAAVGLVIAGFFILFVIFYIIAAVAALICTIIAILAWRHPVTIMGVTTHPEEAKAFLKGGLFGTWFAMMCVNFARFILDMQLNPEYVPHLFIGGYIIGAFGGRWVLEQVQLQRQAELDASPPQLPAVQPRSLPRAEPEPFRFASWDDEEELRR